MRVSTHQISVQEEIEEDEDEEQLHPRQHCHTSPRQPSPKKEAIPSRSPSIVETSRDSSLLSRVEMNEV